MKRSNSTALNEFSVSTLELFEPHQMYSADSNLSTGTTVGINTASSSSSVAKVKASTSSVKLKNTSNPPVKVGTKSISSERLKWSRSRLVDCCYKVSGCTERLPKGTLAEKEHHATCKFRPVPCLIQHCSELIPYHNFSLHHMQHFLHPIFTATLTTNVFFEREDFHCNQRWNPRWMNCYDRDFFVMLSHKVPGMWYVWVWMLGSPEEAAEFTYDIEVSKGRSRKVGTFPVLSVRTTTDDIEVCETCLSMTDYQIKRISQIKDNVVGSFEIDLAIYKTKGSMI